MAGIVLITGCTFEPRLSFQLREEGSSFPFAEGGIEEESVRGDPAAEAAALAEQFRQAVRVGDLSLALSLVDREAILLDELVADPLRGTPGPVTRGEILLAVRRLHQDGLRLYPSDVQVRWLGETALVITQLDILRSVDGGGELAVQEGRAWETLVLVRSLSGWRIRHLHRSVRPLD